MVSAHCKDSSSSDSETQWYLSEDRPEGKEQDRVCQKGQYKSQGDLHLSLSLELIFDQFGSEDPNNVYWDVSDEWE